MLNSLILIIAACYVRETPYEELGVEVFRSKGDDACNLVLQGEKDY